MAAQITVVVHVLTPVVVVKATGVTFKPVSDAIDAPVPAGVFLGTFSVSPPDWTGTVTLSGNDAGDFSVNAAGEVRTAVQLTQGGDYSFNIGATP